MIEKIETLDWCKWLKNTAIFAAPFLLVFLVSIQNGSDMKDALNILYLYGLNVIIDLVRKFIASNPSK
jgi:hypothetical protein